MRARALLLATVSLAGSGYLAWIAAEHAVDYVESRTKSRIEAALNDPVHAWMNFTTDGTIVTLTGEAPNETGRFRTLEIVRQVVDPSRIVDQLTIAAPDPMAAPEFAVEILRNGSDVSLIGLAPLESVEERAIRTALGDGRFTGQITNLLETADYPGPEGWAQSLGFGLSVISGLPRAKVSVTPGLVKVTAVADSAAARDALETSLRATLPEGVALDLAISAPRPVIAPFRFDYSFDGTDGELTACTAETTAEAAVLQAALRLPDGADESSCRIGIGAPTPDWTQAAVQAVEALHALGAGSLEISDTDVTLHGAPDITADQVASAEAVLRSRLPAGYTLTSTVEWPEDGGTAEAGTVPEFSAVLNEAGRLELTGVVGDPTSRDAVTAYAVALFGHENVEQRLTIDPALPEGWPGRVLAGLEALRGIRHGVLNVTGGDVVLSGWGVTEDTEARVSRLLQSKVERAKVDIAFDAAAAEALAQAERLATMSRPEACAEEIGAILSAEAIAFAPGSTRIEPSSQGIIAAISDILQQCPGAGFEIAGHTDSQGSADANRRLSEQRAQAVRDALEDTDLPLITLSAVGYGADQPVAGNDTEAGRRQNRRIELRLIRTDAAAGSETAQAADTGGSCGGEIAALLEEAPIEFDPGSTSIAPASLETLLSVASLLRGCPETGFEVAGYTDDRGDSAANERLSLERAEAVVGALEGFDTGSVTLTARGYGEANPVADNDTSEGRGRNRRIEITALPIGAASDDTVAEADGPVEAGAEEEAMDHSADEITSTPDGCERDIAAILAEGGVQFALGSATISPESAELIEGVAEVLRTCPGLAFEIGGYTDDRGSEEGNRTLSARRAEAVRTALAARDPGPVTLTARGYGEENPVADNGTREGRALNRRIEIRLVTQTPPGTTTEPSSEDAPGDDAAGAPETAADETAAAQTPGTVETDGTDEAATAAASGEPAPEQETGEGDGQ